MSLSWNWACVYAQKSTHIRLTITPTQISSHTRVYAAHTRASEIPPSSPFVVQEGRRNIFDVIKVRSGARLPIRRTAAARDLDDYGPLTYALLFARMQVNMFGVKQQRILVLDAGDPAKGVGGRLQVRC